jgi:hypothetical protein
MPSLTGGSMVPSPFDSFVMAVNANPYFIGLMMLALNLGGRFIGLELTRSQEAFLQNVWVRRVLIFVVLFMGTRNILVAFWMWLAVVFLLGYVLNENSSMCIFGSGLPGSKCAAGEGFQAPALTAEESQVYSILKAKAEKGAAAGPAPEKGSPLPQAPTQGTTPTEPKEAPPSEEKSENFIDTYLESMHALREGFKNPRF